MLMDTISSMVCALTLKEQIRLLYIFPVPFRIPDQLPWSLELQVQPTFSCSPLPLLQTECCSLPAECSFSLLLESPVLSRHESVETQIWEIFSFVRGARLAVLLKLRFLRVTQHLSELSVLFTNVHWARRRQSPSRRLDHSFKPSHETEKLQESPFCYHFYMPIISCPFKCHIQKFPPWWDTWNMSSVREQSEVFYYFIILG